MMAKTNRNQHENNMVNWLKNLVVERSVPALWVEHVWLIATKDPVSVIREVAFRPGVNVIWAEEPDDDAATGRRAAGHGVGKTSLCLLLRHVLCDESDGINTLRAEVYASFPEGGIAALVHIGTDTWTVFRPFSSYRQNIAARTETLESLLNTGTTTHFDEYQEALSKAFIQSLPVNTIPGSGQPMEWRHVLAWCARDQRTRFDNFFHWRAGEGAGFRRGKQDPPLLMKAVLGILNVEAATLLSDIEATDQQLAHVGKRIEEVEREPEFNLNRVERSLRRVSGVDDAVSMEPIDLFTPSVLSKLDALMEQMVQAEKEFDMDIEILDGQRQGIFQKLGNIRDDASILELEKLRLTAQHDGNQQEYDRLTTEIKKLRNRTGRCDLGDVEFTDCTHIQKRLMPTFTIQRIRDERALTAAKAECEKKMAELDARLTPLKAEVDSYEQQVSSLQVQARRLETRRATSALERNRILELKDEYIERKRAQASGTATAELMSLSKEQEKLAENRQSLLLKSELKRRQQTSRVSELAHLTAKLAERLLDTNATGWFDEHSDDAPFRLAVGGEAYHVMEVLIGDLVCMVDAIVNTSSRHPAFLIHDCPREADMGSHLYHDFLEIVREIETHLGYQGIPSFQYIVTTTSPPPRALQQAPYLRLTLKPGADDGLLFGRQFTHETSELPG
jgi:hypothetical protein